MGFLAAIPAAIGGLFGGGAAAGLGATTALSGMEAMTGATVGASALGGAGAAGAGAGLGGLTLGTGLGMLSPLLGSLGKVAASGSDLLKTFGDVPLGDVVGSASVPAASAPGLGQVGAPIGDSLAKFKTAAQFGGSLRDLMGSGSDTKTLQQTPAPMALPQPPPPLVPPPSTSTPLGMGSSYTPTAKTLADVMFRR